MIDLNHQNQKIKQLFSCQQCGNCCRRPGGFVYLNESETVNIAHYLKMLPSIFKQQYLSQDLGWLVLSSPKHNPICFLDQKGNCRIYAARPEQCRSYPNWPEIWTTPENILNETAICPGLKLAYQKAQEIPSFQETE